MHVYCEKPLTHTVHEARLVAEAAKKHSVATQMGTQIHAGDNYRRVVEIIQSGAIGDVTEVHVWVGKGWGGGERPEGGQEPPAELELGPLAGPGAGPALLARPLPSGPMAPLVGLRHRHAGRHGLPLHGPAVLGPQAAASDHVRSGRAGGPSGNVPAGADRPLRVPRARGPAAGALHLVRRQPASRAKWPASGCRAAA